MSAGVATVAGRQTDGPQRAVAIIVQVYDALADAHAQGIVHRDVKLSNILLTGSDFAYLVDFGIATSDEAGPSLTATGDTIGTFGFMAPRTLRRPTRRSPRRHLLPRLRAPRTPHRRPTLRR